MLALPACSAASAQGHDGTGLWTKRQKSSSWGNATCTGAKGMRVCAVTECEHVCVFACWGCALPAHTGLDLHMPLVHALCVAVVANRYQRGRVCAMYAPGPFLGALVAHLGPPCSSLSRAEAPTHA